MVQYRAETHNVKFVAVGNAEDLMSGRDVGILGMLEFDQPEISKYFNNNKTILMIKNLAGNGNSSFLERKVEQG